MNFLYFAKNLEVVFLIFLNVVTPVFFLVVIGYFIGPKLNIDARSLSRPAYYVFVPAFVFNIFSKTKIDFELAFMMVCYIFLVQISAAFLGYFVAKILRQSKEISAAFVLIATFGNVGNFGIPLIEFRLGEISHVPATIYFLSTIFISFIICVGVASWVRSGGANAVFSVFKTPALLALIPSLFFNISDIQVPIFISRMTELLGQAMIPVMLISLGVQMSEMDKIKINFNVFAASTTRLIGVPIIAFFLVKFFELGGVERSSGILQSAMPAAVLVSIIAMEYKLCPKFVTTTVLFSTVFSIFTLTIILTLV